MRTPHLTPPVINIAYMNPYTLISAANSRDHVFQPVCGPMELHLWVPRVDLAPLSRLRDEALGKTEDDTCVLRKGCVNQSIKLPVCCAILQMKTKLVRWPESIQLTLLKPFRLRNKGCPLETFNCSFSTMNTIKNTPTHKFMEAARIILSNGPASKILFVRKN